MNPFSPLGPVQEEGYDRMPTKMAEQHRYVIDDKQELMHGYWAMSTILLYFACKSKINGTNTEIQALLNNFYHVIAPTENNRISH